MATATATNTALTAPHALKLPASRSAATATRPQPAAPAHRPPRTSPGLDADGGIVGLIGGSGALLIQLCALIPGVLPCLLLAAVLALPWCCLSWRSASSSEFRWDSGGWDARSSGGL